MVYIRLAQPEQTFNKVSIKEFHYSGSNITCRYKVYKNFEGKNIELESQRLIIKSPDLEKVLNTKSTFLGGYDCICKGILEYIIDQKIKIGTLEVE